jgi:hypothetical protein
MVQSYSSGVALEDEDAYWRRHYGIDRPLTNDRAWRNFGLFAVFSVFAMAVLFGVVMLVVWATS